MPFAFGTLGIPVVTRGAKAFPQSWETPLGTPGILLAHQERVITLAIRHLEKTRAELLKSLGLVNMSFETAMVSLVMIHSISKCLFYQPQILNSMILYAILTMDILFLIATYFEQICSC